MKFDYYIFDLDNSLLEIPNPLEYFDDVLAKTIKKLSRKEVPPFEVRYQFWYAGENYKELLKEWGINDCDIFWKTFDNIDFNKRVILKERNKLRIYDDVKPVLEKLKKANKKIALVSNTADYIVDFILNEFKLSHLFHEKFGLGFEKDQDVAKPSPKGILHVLKKLGYNNNGNGKNCNAIMVGDSIVDIIAAKRANITACLIRRIPDKYSGEIQKWEYKPDFIIDNLEELLKL
ncbi:MAG: HAD family hydrolase [Promethearchaeia archaeon]